MPKGSFIELWIWRKKKIILAEALQDVEFLLSVYRTETLVCCCLVLPRLGTCLRPCGRCIVRRALSLWASDMQINLTLKEVPMETKRSLLTLCSDGEERGELSMWGLNGIQTCLDKLTRLHEAKLLVYEELILKDQRDKNINILKGYSVTNANTRMRFTLYRVVLRILDCGTMAVDTNAELFTRSTNWKDFSLLFSQNRSIKPQHIKQTLPICVNDPLPHVCLWRNGIGNNWFLHRSSWNWILDYVLSFYFQIDTATKLVILLITFAL